MLNSFRFAASVFALLAVSFVTNSQVSNAQIGPATATKLIFYNASNVDVAVGVQVPGLCPTPTACAQEDGCPTQTIAYLRTKNLTLNGPLTPLTPFSSTDKGWFLLKRGHRVQFMNVGTNKYTGQASYCLQGLNFGFGNFEASCPDSTNVPPGPSQFPNTKPGTTFNQPIPAPAPNGTTGFECTINLPGTVNGQSTINNPSNPSQTTPVPTGESMDITCLAGANCTLNVQAIPPSTGPFWTAVGTTQTFKSAISFRNSWVDITNKCDNNCVDPATGKARLGVFPYGCSQCNSIPDPKPQCPPGGPVGIAQFCAAKNGLPPNNGCQLARSPLVTGVQKFGGTIQVNYLGPLTPPGTCPPGSKLY